MKKMQHFLLAAALLLCANASLAQTAYICSGADVATAAEVQFSENGTVINGSQRTSTVDSITFNVPRLRFVGGDISMLSKYESQGATYKTSSGQKVSDLITYLKEQGWNTMRVRLFVDPSKAAPDKAVVQDLSYVSQLGRRIKQAGLLFMLDFHYSDTWADPGKQWTPDAWKSLSNDQLNTRIYEYTRDCLNELVSAGAAPDFIQTGNEISYGMLWGTEAAAGGSTNNLNRCYTNSPTANWTRFTNLLKQAGRACREVCPRAQIIIHTERAGDVNVLTNFYNKMKSAAVDYDIIGLSYYPYFKHGTIEGLESTLRQIENQQYGKLIQIVETGYPSQWAVPGTTYDYSSKYAYSTTGQKQFVADLITMLRRHQQVNGLSWWYPEACAAGATGDLKNGWYNAGLFDNNTGNALPALYELKNFK